MGWFKRKPKVDLEQKCIIEKMEKAIRFLEDKATYRKNALAGCCIRRLSARLDEITDNMIEEMTTPRCIHSKVYRFDDIFCAVPFDDFFELRGNANDNAFAKFLADNKLTMAIDERHEAVKFAYGRHTWFESGWLEFAGYDY